MELKLFNTKRLLLERNAPAIADSSGFPVRLQPRLNEYLMNLKAANKRDAVC